MDIVSDTIPFNAIFHYAYNEMGLGPLSCVYTCLFVQGIHRAIPATLLGSEARLRG